MFARAVVWGGGDKNQIDVVSLHGGVAIVEHMQAATNGVNILTLELRNYDSG